MLLSVVICAHNPRTEFLVRTLTALKRQSQPQTDWELILIDNCSVPSLSSWVEVDWHVNARIVREEEVGLTNARLRGIAEAATELILFVDDDNLLFPDFLEVSLKIATTFPQLGAWGGRCLGEFVDGPPEEWTREYWHLLAIHEVDRDYWSNTDADSRVIPAGAGMVVRRCVAEVYAKNVRSSPLRCRLDRRGNDLISGGDIDMAATALDLRMGVGRFASLGLFHLIPAERLTEEYLLRLSEGITCSIKLLRAIRGTVKPEPKGIIRRLRRALRMIMGGARSRSFRFGLAIERGLQRADLLLAELATPSVAHKANHNRNDA